MHHCAWLDFVLLGFIYLFETRFLSSSDLELIL